MHHRANKSDIISRSLVVICVVVFILPFINACKQEQAAPPPPVKEDKRPVMRIGFVGNENTHTNNLSLMVQNLAKTDPSSHFKLEVNTLTGNNSSLAQMWKAEVEQKVMRPGNWDYVILQPHSMWASTEGHVYLSQQSISVWSRYINSMGARPILFMTWPLEKYHASYGDIKYATTLKNYRNMHRLIRGYSKAMSKKNDMLITPVGDYWMQALAIAPDIPLYAEDGSSPTVAGSYLTALVIYKTLVNGSLNKVAYMPPGMTQETKDLLIAIASTKIEK